MEDLTAIEPIGKVFNLRADKKFVGADGNVLLPVDPGPIQVVGTYTGEEKFAIYLLRNERYVKLVESSPAAGGGGWDSATYLRDLRSQGRRLRLPLPARGLTRRLRNPVGVAHSHPARQLDKAVA